VPRSLDDDGWRWGGCSDNVQYGVWFAMMFVDAAERTQIDVGGARRQRGPDLQASQCFIEHRLTATTARKHTHLSITLGGLVAE